jgi:acetyl-CoA decarbonylase/synthase, CODH/ACS complex subunit delta
MAVDLPKGVYTGAIREIGLGRGDVTVGGSSAYPFYLFEGETPHRPRIAIEVNDVAGEGWAEAIRKPYEDVLSDPVAWAKKAIEEYGADMIHLALTSTDPNGHDAPADKAAETAKRVADAIDVPLCVWGTTNVTKDAEVLRAVCEATVDHTLMIGPVQKDNYKQIGAGIIASGHIAVSNSPIDINLAKQLNVLLGNLGVSDERMIIDPTVGGLGYGLEYTYSVMERCRMAALVQQDDQLRYPMYNNMAFEVWKVKEVRDEDEKLGDVARRGMLMEAMTASVLLTAGADILVMRYLEAIKMVRQLMTDLGVGN